MRSASVHLYYVYDVEMSGLCTMLYEICAKRIQLCNVSHLDVIDGKWVPVFVNVSYIELSKIILLQKDIIVELIRTGS